MPKECEALLTFTTTSSIEEAQKLARHLVEVRVVACVTILPKAESIYRWEGNLRCEGECLLMMKTTREHWESLEKELKSIHSYDVPEMLAIPVEKSSPEYLKWLSDSLR